MPLKCMVAGCVETLSKTKVPEVITKVAVRCRQYLQELGGQVSSRANDSPDGYSQVAAIIESLLERGGALKKLAVTITTSLVKLNEQSAPTAKQLNDKCDHCALNMNMLVATKVL